MRPKQAGNAAMVTLTGFQLLQMKRHHMQVYNMRQLINNLTAPMFFHLVARKSAVWRCDS